MSNLDIMHKSNITEGDDIEINLKKEELNQGNHENNIVNKDKKAADVLQVDAQAKPNHLAQDFMSPQLKLKDNISF